MRQLTLGSLFSGIGGFELGLERTGGFKTEWQVEIDSYCQRVLAKHWPNVRRWDDVRTFPPPGEWGVDVICGGFPCQDISNAGKRSGIEGSRSGLWSEYARIIGELRPRFVIVENVAALLVRGMDRVCGDLAALGYDTRWRIVSAKDVGAPHLRERIWIVADERKYVADASSNRCDNSVNPESITRIDKNREAIEAKRRRRIRIKTSRDCVSEICMAYTKRRNGQAWSGIFGPISDSSRDWAIEPDVGRVAHGVPSRVDRIRALGNAVVPQCAEWIGRRLLEAIGDEA